MNICPLSQCLKQHSQINAFSRVWWFRLFSYFERNVQGVVPRHYQVPWLQLPCRLSPGGRVKYSRVDSL